MNNNFYYRTQQPPTQLDMLRQQSQNGGMNMNQQNMNGQPYYQQGQNVYYQQGQAQGQPVQNQQSQPAQQSDERIWVQGEVGAIAYWVAPGSTVVLWDVERPVFYIKTVNLNNVPLPMQTFDYSEHIKNPVPIINNVDTTNLVTREELNVIANRLKQLESTISQPLTGAGAGGESVNAESNV